jgi:general secretion pathway protein A
MYEAFFGLQQAPFSIAPDPHYLYLSERHREALAHLLYGLDGGGGFVVLTGEIGAGKTTVCRCVMAQIPEHCHLAYIFNPKLTVIELVRSVCDELGKAAFAQPAQERTWVSLTDDQIKEIVGPWGDTPIKGYTRKLIDQIDAKLRENNNG